MRTRSRNMSRPQRRKLVWGRLWSGTQNIAALTTVAIQPLSALETNLGADLIGCTVRRVRASFKIRGSVAGNGIRCTMAMGIFPSALAAAPLSPETDFHEDWMTWHAYFAEPPIATESPCLNNLELDVRAQRRLDELQQTLFWFVRNSHPTDGLTFSYGVSTLVALP